MTDRIESILKEREGTHGDFGINSELTEHLVETCVIAPNYSKLTSEQKYFINVTMMKMARILTGGHNEFDHYQDIAGYAELVCRSLNND